MWKNKNVPMCVYSVGHLEDVPDYLKKSEEFVGTRAALEPGLNFCKVKELAQYMHLLFCDFVEKNCSIKMTPLLKQQNQSIKNYRSSSPQ
jgi:hypothetical protein